MTNIKQVEASGALAIARVNTDDATVGIDLGLTIGATGAPQTTGVGNGAVSGNSRGTQGAVDLQTSRTVATAIASALRTFAAGADNQVGSTANAVFGERNTLIDQQSLVTGLEGYSPFRASQVLSAGSFGGGRGEGSAQRTQILLRGTTTNATPAALSTPTTLSPRPTAVIGVSIMVVGFSSAAGTAGIYKFEGAFKRVSGTGSLIGSITKTVLGENVAGWDVNVAMSAGLDSLQITVTGAASTTIRWVAQCDLVEVI